jgi:hypothetical protein
MTCKEKLAKDHHEWDENDRNAVMGIDCPHTHGFLDRPSYCDAGFNHDTCDKCWNREIPEEVDAVDAIVEPVIKDSGDRTEFSSGAVRDMHKGKGRMDLLPWAAIMEVSKHCERGADKYGEHNVDKGIPTSSLCDSAARHLGKYLDGWTDEDHLLASAWNLLWALQMRIKNPEMVDTPWKKEG